MFFFPYLFQPDHKNFAKKLLDWINHGFPELGDYAGLGQGATTAKVVTNKNFLKDPHGVKNYICIVMSVCTQRNAFSSVIVSETKPSNNDLSYLIIC